MPQEKRIYVVRTKSRLDLVEIEASGYYTGGSGGMTEFVSRNDCDQTISVAAFHTDDVISIMSNPKRIEYKNTVDFAPRTPTMSDFINLENRLDVLGETLEKLVSEPPKVLKAKRGRKPTAKKV